MTIEKVSLKKEDVRQESKQCYDQKRRKWLAFICRPTI